MRFFIFFKKEEGKRKKEEGNRNKEGKPRYGVFIEYA